MSGFVCHLERGPTGALASARLVGPGLDRTWTAPETTDDTPGAAGALIRTAADWVVDQLGTATRILELVTVDTAGGICSWISAPSPEPAVVTAAIRQHAGATSPLQEAISSPARSTQALALPGQTAGSATTRYPVLSLPDAPVRVFLDELDRRGIEVRAVESLWHALAAAWDPSAPDDDDRRAPHAERIVAGDGPATAIVMLDAGDNGDGRLVWAWSRQGALLAAGSMRLLTVRPRREAARDPFQESAPDDATAIIDLARRVGGESREEQPSAALACSDAEVGRLTLDWLAFAAQTGVNPDRIIAFGAPVVAQSNGSAGQVVSIAHALGHAWPGATIDAVDDRDPVGSTLRRLSTGSASPAAQLADPRASLSSLTRRPSRLDRRVFRWTALAVIAVSAGVGALGWQLRRAADQTQQQIQLTRTRQSDLLTALTAEFPDLNAEKLRRSAKPEDELTLAINSLRATIDKEAAPRPVADELLNIVRAIEPYADSVKVQKIDINLVAAVRLTLPDSNTEIGPQILADLRERSDWLDWQGQFVSGSRGQEGRPYVLTGQWRSRPAQGAKP